VTTFDYAACVRRGAALLDQRGPVGWRDRVDEVNLDISSVDNCVVAQAYRDVVNRSDLPTFDYGLGRLGEPTNAHEATQWLTYHGFDVPVKVDDDYDELTDAWRDYLRSTAIT
jgi:hypothetical protein